jgi:hypothetical protein
MKRVPFPFRAVAFTIATISTALAVARSVAVADETPALPPDPVALYSIHKVVSDRDRFTREVVGPKGTVLIDSRPLLTLRDLELLTVRPFIAEDPRKPGQGTHASGRLTFSEWGARRRAKAESDNTGSKLATLRAGSVESIATVRGRSLGRVQPFFMRGTAKEIAGFNERVQAALKDIQEQPIKTVREIGMQALAPGWKLETFPSDQGLQLKVSGPNGPGGMPWAAKAELPCATGAPFIVCWETKSCVLWAASARGLVAVHFSPEGSANVLMGELENTLRFQDAPASVREQIERVFPPRDGDPASKFGSIEGTVILANAVAPGITVEVITHFDRDDHDGQSFTTKTDENGRFRFDRVRAPCSVQISMDALQWIDPHSGKPKTTSGPSLCFHSHLAKDEKLEFTLGGEGRPVAGRIVDPENERRDWSKSHIEFVLVPPASEPVAAYRKTGFGYIVDAYEAFLRSKNGAAYAPRKHPLNADGTFRFDRIPSAGYWIYVYPDGATESRRIKALSMELTPGGKTDTPLDLGPLPFPPNDAPPFGS